MDQQIKVDLLLSDYEEVAAQAVDNGIDLTTQVFFHSFTLCRTIFRFLYSFSLCVFFPFRLNCTFTFRGVHFFTVLLRFLKLLSPFWFLNSLLKEFTANWNYIQSVFFSTTILTTIGKNKKNFGKCITIHKRWSTPQHWQFLEKRSRCLNWL